MSKPKHVPNASALITEAFDKMPDHIKAIAVKLRELVHKAEPKIIEDWKWGPNFYCMGMVCNVWGFKEHASITFFNGVNMKDELKLFNYGELNSKNRTIKFTSIDEVNEKAILTYLKEAVRLNKAGEIKANKTVEIPLELKKILSEHNLLAVFERQSFTYRKEAVFSITSAQQSITKVRRIEKLIAHLDVKG
jgi:hypothetical protein